MCVYCGHELADERHDPASRWHHVALIAPYPLERESRGMTPLEIAAATRQIHRAEQWHKAHRGRPRVVFGRYDAGGESSASS